MHTIRDISSKFQVHHTKIEWFIVSQTRSQIRRWNRRRDAQKNFPPTVSGVIIHANGGSQVTWRKWMRANIKVTPFVPDNNSITRENETFHYDSFESKHIFFLLGLKHNFERLGFLKSLSFEAVCGESVYGYYLYC